MYEKRTVGIELEGYVDTLLTNRSIENWNFVPDGSLSSVDETEECGECEGCGNEVYDCDACDGEGSICCDTCDGSGSVTVECCDCEGTGEDEEEECHTCEGSGEYETECFDCDGYGHERCSSCDGDGEHSRDCNTCGGSGEIGTEYNGVECVSTILNEDNLDEAIEQIFDYVEDCDWGVDETCGTHIHVGADDLTCHDVRKLAILMSAIEPVIYATQRENRLDCTYCKILDSDMVRNLITYTNKEGMSKDDLSEFIYGAGGERYWRTKYTHHRYYGLNIHSFFYRNTIEFRYFEGISNPEIVKFWAKFCINVVEFAKHATFEQIMAISTKLFHSNSIGEMFQIVGDILELEMPSANNIWAFNKSKNISLKAIYELPEIQSNAV